MMEAVQIRLLFVDNDRSSIMVNVSVVIALLNDDSFVTVLMITVADDVTVTVPVTISVTLTNRYANRADTNPHFFSSSRHCTANSSYGGDHYGILNHCVLLSLLSSGKAIPRRRDRSRFRSELVGNKRAQDGAPMLYVGLTLEPMV
ncbi:MAG TPA: hypothetical protein VIH91_02645 [Terriglobales bacterium]|jgi:hypothetical protein